MKKSPSRLLADLSVGKSKENYGNLSFILVFVGTRMIRIYQDDSSFSSWYPIKSDVLNSHCKRPLVKHEERTLLTDSSHFKKSKSENEFPRMFIQIPESILCFHLLKCRFVHEKPDVQIEFEEFWV